ncbi:hypothetical protein PV728_39230 [Streptomyces europaeiscabiei]|uniref:hypothetical protein n=1 Tax=Streptomyces TaxID=1883 RepID=UPI000A36E88B|nr:MULTISPECIES: hypothetical protein [Streptomyces]MDX3636164.1 hypothetical protein [Streptomyces europaeiscabiei]MDX3654258.1 hypothetical protein [Streptomyces europaeiscabiei]WUD30127.1 hypothetical protein OG858_00970 [Streptomyces europaeiscabiei]
MRTYRYKVQKSGFGLILGIAAEAIRLTVRPTAGAPVSDRVWLDASEVNNAYRGSRLTLTESEVATLRVGLGKVSGDIELVESSPYILITVRALEIFEVDYAEVALAPAIAGWAEAEFSLAPRRCHATRDSATGEFTLDWDE